MPANIELIHNLTPEQVNLWRHANRDMVWGWKRDVGAQKRLVYFSGRIELDEQNVYLNRFYFFYWITLVKETSAALVEQRKKAEIKFPESHGFRVLKVKDKGDLRVVEFSLGEPTASDINQTTRLKLRKPRKKFLQPDFPEPQTVAPDQSLFPADLYVGSGISYEAGLPTLCDMHDIFGVDCHESSNFMVGSRDWLPAALAEEGIGRLRKFCNVHTAAVLAEPTPAMQTIASLNRLQLIRKIFTDNV